MGPIFAAGYVDRFRASLEHSGVLRGVPKPPAMPSFNKPQTPLGSAAVMAIPATIGLESSLPHSSVVKFDLTAIWRVPLDASGA